MRKFQIGFITILFLIVLIGCAGFMQNTYKSLYIAGTSYDMAMKSVARLQAQGSITAQQRAEINQLANYYYVAYHATVDAFEIYKKTESKENKEALMVALSAASANWIKMASYINRIAPNTLANTLEEVK